MSLRLCKDCTHYRRVDGDRSPDLHFCDRDVTKRTNLVTGDVSTYGRLRCEVERSNSAVHVNLCGVEGRFYQPKDAK